MHLFIVGKMAHKICHSADETERTLEKQSIRHGILFRLNLTSYEEGRTQRTRVSSSCVIILS